MQTNKAEQDRTWDQSDYFTSIGAPEREGYRFGFNGKEKDNEDFVGAYDFGARMYDGRLGRWLSVDPSHKNYPRTSPYAAFLNSPMIYVDSDGKDVYFIIDTGGSNFGQSIVTRKKEIESGNGFNSEKDIVIVLQVSDLGKLEEIVESKVMEVTGVYGKTVEVNFYGHGATDGPVGATETSKNSLSDCSGRTGFEGDQKQLSPTGWKDIDFNFDEDGSLVAFYGCNTAAFAQKFLTYQPDCDYAVGLGGGAGASYTACGEIDRVWSNPWGANEFVVDVDDDDQILPKLVYSREVYKNEEIGTIGTYDCEGNYCVDRKESTIQGNVTLKRLTNKPQGTSGCD